LRERSRRAGVVVFTELDRDREQSLP